MGIDKKILQRLRESAPNFEDLDLSNKYLHDEDILELCDALKSNTTLRRLHLLCNHIGNAGAIALAKITTLSYLDLTCNHIKDEGAIAFAENTTLIVLRLSDNNISNIGGQALAKNTNLMILDIYGTYHIIHKPYNLNIKEKIEVENPIREKLPLAYLDLANNKVHASIDNGLAKVSLIYLDLAVSKIRKETLEKNSHFLMSTLPIPHWSIIKYYEGKTEVNEMSQDIYDSLYNRIELNRQLAIKLISACQASELNTVTSILKQGVRPYGDYIQDQLPHGDTLLHAAVRQRNMPLLSILLPGNLDRNVKNKDNLTYSKLAEKLIFDIRPETVMVSLLERLHAMQDQLEQTSFEHETLKTQHMDAKELISSSEQALQEQMASHESRSQEVESTLGNIKALEQRLASSEVLMSDKTEELILLQRKIQELEQNPVSSPALTNLQAQAQQLIAEKNQLEQENKQLSEQCSSLRIRLQILETEHMDFEQLQEAGRRNLNQLQSRLRNAQTELGKRESEWQHKFRQEQNAKDRLAQAKTEVEQQAQLLEIHLNLYKKHGLTPKERAFQNFLSDVNRLIKNTTSKAPVCYISYAWEDNTTDAGKAANLAMQTFLLRIERDLKTLGLTVFLDVTSMNGNINDCMMENIAKSDCFLLIGTERLKLRAEDVNTNVGKEWAEIKQKMQQNPNAVLPLLYQGDFATSFPPGIFSQLIRDCRQPDCYYDFMAKMISPMSFIRAVLGIHLNGCRESLEENYQVLWDKLETKFNNIELELSNATLCINQPVPHYLRPTASSSSRSVSSSSSSSSSSSHVRGMHHQWQGSVSARRTSTANTISSLGNKNGFV